MSDYTLEELEAAYKAISSSYRKIGKVLETLSAKPNPPKSQITLAERNYKAMMISLNLIMEEMGKFDGVEDDCVVCDTTKECACPKMTCPNHKKCCACVIKHKDTDSLPFCLFLDNDGDKSVANYYRKLKKRFEDK